MSKLICLQGLPASGKTTRAKELLVEYGDAVRINRDTLRIMLHDNKWNYKKEKITLFSAVILVQNLLSQVKAVIIDDTNFNPHTVNQWQRIAKECGAEFEIIPVETDVYTCIRRNVDRGEPVGKHVIIGMAMQYGKYPIPESGFVICDIDGTLADINHRLHYLKENPKNWDAFFLAAFKDDVREEVVAMLNTHKERGREVIFVTGRPEKYRALTEEWLSWLSYTALFMRRDGDHRPDKIVKEQILNKYFPDKSKIVEVIDDRPSVIAMWRSHNLKVVDVGDGQEF